MTIYTYFKSGDRNVELSGVTKKSSLMQLSNIRDNQRINHLVVNHMNDVWRLFSLFARKLS